MGKTITQQARGHGSLTYRVRRRAYRFKITYPQSNINGIGKIRKLINSPAHSTPLMIVDINNVSFYSPAFEGSYEGQDINIDNGKVENGSISKIKDIPSGTKIFNIELSPGKGGKVMRSAGCCAFVSTKDALGVEVLIRRRKLKLKENCRATVGVAAGDGRKLKPIVKAGKKHFMMLAKGRKWHRTSAIKTNAVDHPFGSGRGKRIKSKIAIRNAPPGAKVGHIRPRRTGHVK